MIPAKPDRKFFAGTESSDASRMRIHTRHQTQPTNLKTNFWFASLALLSMVAGFGLGASPARAAGQPTAAKEPTPTAWLTATTSELLTGCRVPADSGIWLFTPDGKGNYRALWTRDFAYMVENAGDLIRPEQVEACLRYLIRGIRADGATPDRVQPDGVAVYVGGPPEHPLGEPNLDNAPFLVIAVDTHLKKLQKKSAQELFRAWSNALDRAMDWVPLADSGLVWNDPVKPHSPYGFTDTIAKTGALFFESLLYWTACRRMAEWHQQFGGPEAAKKYRRRADLIERQLETLWDGKSGAFLAATKDCRQLDIWGNAYAIWLDFPLGQKRQRVLRFLATNYERCVWRGQVRHLLAGEHWQRLLAPVPPERYQNGAYWATASGWMMFALSRTDSQLAHQMWTDLITDFQAGGVCECVNEGYRQLPSYVVSAANPLAAARRLQY